MECTQTQINPRQIWYIRVGETPAIVRYCKDCGEIREYRSTDRFRINANGHQLDVWLVYRCDCCDSRWNRSIYERVSVRRIEARQYRQLLSNDQRLARRYAFGEEGLRRLGLRLKHGSEYNVSIRGDVDLTPSVVLLRMDEPVNLRLDRLLAHQLEISRAQLKAFWKRGDIRVEPHSTRALRSQVRDGQRILLSL